MKLANLENFSCFCMLIKWQGGKKLFFLAPGINVDSGNRVFLQKTSDSRRNLTLSWAIFLPGEHFLRMFCMWSTRCWYLVCVEWIWSMLYWGEGLTKRWREAASMDLSRRNSIVSEICWRWRQIVLILVQPKSVQEQNLIKSYMKTNLSVSYSLKKS